MLLQLEYGLKLTVIQRPIEKRMMSREIIVKELSCLIGINIKMLGKRSIMKEEKLLGKDVSRLGLSGVS
jgi:hypothetical protein